MIRTEWAFKNWLMFKFGCIFKYSMQYLRFGFGKVSGYTLQLLLVWRPKRVSTYDKTNCLPWTFPNSILQDWGPLLKYPLAGFHGKISCNLSLTYLRLLFNLDDQGTHFLAWMLLFYTDQFRSGLYIQRSYLLIPDVKY